MKMPDKTLTCKDCNATFIFSEQEQAYFRERGYDNEPQRCPDCRAARKQSRGAGASNGRSDREMFPAVCAQCGKATTVPFKPNTSKPVYCKECYQSRNR
jgi:CxxC-x17-CxxC domain-containing protein